MENRQLGGIGFAVGNLALIANGLIAYTQGNNPDARAAGLWRVGSNVLLGVGAVALAHYGERPVERQQARLEEKLAAFLQAKGVPLEAAVLKKADAETQRGWFAHLDDFIYDHPMECVNIYTGLASGGMAVSGLLRRREGNRQAGDANLAFAGLTVAGVLASVLIPEKTPEKLAAEGQTGAWAKIQEKPLNYARWLFMAADASAGKEAWGEYKAADQLPTGTPYKPWQFGMSALSLTAMLTFLCSDWITGAGSKKASGTAEAHQTAQARLVSAAATMLANEPPERLTELAAQTAGYLTNQPGLRFVDRDPKAITKEILAAAKTSDSPALGTHTAQALNARPATLEK